MMLIDIDDLLPKDLDLTTLDRDSSSGPPAPNTHNCGNATAQEA